MRRGRPLLVLLAQVTAIALGTATSIPPAQANLGFCATLLESARDSYRSARHGPIGVLIHQAIEHGGADSFHPKASVRRSLFQVLLPALRTAQARSPNPEPKLQAFLRTLRRHSPEEIALIADQVATQSRKAPFALPSNPRRWARRILAALPSHLADINAKYTWLDGWRVERAAFDHAVRIQNGLQSAGVHTRILPRANEDGRRLAVLQILDLTSPQIEASANLPVEELLFQPFFETPQARSYLSIAQQEKGMIVIDPGMGLDHVTTLAYFDDFADPSQNPTPARWIIGLRLDSPLLDLEHEWQHKLDVFDRRAEFESQLLLARKPERSWENLGTLHRLGHVIEDSHWYEVIATRHELNLMSGKADPGHIEYIRAQLYHQSSLRMAALARILQEPFNREHYRLWLQSWKKP